MQPSVSLVPVSRPDVPDVPNVYRIQTWQVQCARCIDFPPGCLPLIDAVLVIESRQLLKFRYGNDEHAVALAGLQIQSMAHDVADPLRRDLALVLCFVALDEPIRDVFN